ncbi:MAG TPA: FMN-binding negative transcriptional regulator [Candidatus Eremiobacteraceae bacterium]|nr:FMN-binding negative transcriptional regulator [Candidatus Eremiobacteraceae bacterium]
MYIPNQYRAPDSSAPLEIIRSFPLATVISVVNGSPFVSYLPFTIAQADPTLVLTSHCARANPHWTYFEQAPVLLIFRGPDGYISPRFYQDCTINVPSWNYVAVHCAGTATIAPEHDTDEILRSLVDQMEASAQKPWRVEDMDDDYLQRLKKAIVPFSVSVSTLTAKFKLSQRGSDGEINGLIAGLREAGTEKDRLLADAMELGVQGRGLPDAR